MGPDLVAAPAVSRAPWWPVAALGTGGVLWGVHGPLTMLQPWGEEVRFSESRGYSVVVDDALFVLYNGPGAAGLLLTALGVLALRRRLRSRRPHLAALGTVSTRIAIAFGLVSVLGVVALFDPVFTAARVLGALLLGLGCVCLAVGVRGDTPPGRWPTWLAATGALSLGLLPLWPLVYAVEVLPEWAGAAYFGVFALAWLLGAAGLLRTTPTRL